MSSFTVALTPKRTSMAGKGNESRQPTEVCMAPFSAKSIVQFEDVPVTKTAKRTLKIINPSDDEIQVKVTKLISPEHNLTIEWNEKTVPANASADMALAWTPQIDIACKETMQLTDNRNFRKEVIIILKSKSNKLNKTVRKYPSVSAMPSTSSKARNQRLKSPTAALKVARLKSPRMKSPKVGLKANARLSQPRSRVLRSENANNNTNNTANTVRWNSSIHRNPRAANVFAPLSIPTIVYPLTEENVKSAEKSEFDLDFSARLSPGSDSSLKENISPLTPRGISSIIDKLKFTPITETKSHPSLALENLANLPTPIVEPVSEEQQLQHQLELYRDIRPRRLTAKDLMGRVDEMAEAALDDEVATSSMCINKTFDIKSAEASSPGVNGSNESIGGVIDECNRSMPLNKTTTLSRPLAMIEEEECPAKDNQTVVLEKTYSKPSQEQEDLKRDIKLIGTPLRKFSESLKDLSLKSPNVRVGLQQGSMPNLNDMEGLRSIEQNRYFNKCHMQTIHEDQSRSLAKTQEKRALEDSPDVPVTASPSHLSTQIDFVFSQHEIKAQSSRFDLRELESKSRENTPSEGFKSPKSKMCKTSHKRKSADLSFSDSMSNESIASTFSVSSAKSGVMLVSPPKKPCPDLNLSQLRLAATPKNASAACYSRNRQSVQSKKLKLSTTLALAKKVGVSRYSIGGSTPGPRLYDPDAYMQQYLNPDPFAATTTCDPFLASTSMPVYLNIEKHQIVFKKWLNALVSIPEDLYTDCNAKIDVGKLFNEVRNKELTLAPTKEEQSMNYLTKARLESLRRAAIHLYMSEEMRIPCAKVIVYVNKNAIRIRHDRNLHLDIVMQRTILELLLCFNPLWLRLGLEVVYGEKIHLHSSNDVVGLSTFILNRLFRDKLLEGKHTRAYTLSGDYSDYIKRFTLEKVLLLLLFLDKAKSHRIIKHNPCLFVKKSPYKETKDILCRFSSEMLANIGDIKRDLKRLGYVLEHKQTFLDEFDYAFNNLAVDLRDGVRLTRVMEIILLRDDLSKQLRVPAISRLQRVFNVNLALSALRQADFELKGNIEAADIVDGHLEKTFSLLWQIIYKFRSPKFNAAAKVVQLWWRRLWLRVVIRRRIHQKELDRRQAAATKIQALFRAHMARRYVAVHKAERTQAALVLQRYMRRHLAQKRVVRMVRAIVAIQRWYRAQVAGAECRQSFLRLRECTVFLQRCIRRQQLSKKLLLVVEQLRLFQQQQREAAVRTIQRRWRTFLTARAERQRFLQLRRAAVVFQRRYRARILMKQQRQSFLMLRECTIKMQQRHRANLLMAQQRTCFLEFRAAVIQVQQRRRGLLAMRAARASYQRNRHLIVNLQRRVRAKQAMQQQRMKYLELRAAACCLQRHYRARLLMRQQRTLYQATRERLVFVQRKWRAIRLARQHRSAFQRLRQAALVVQRQYRAKRQMLRDRSAFQKLRATTVTVQRRFRSKLLTERQRSAFLRQRQAALVLQRALRARIAAQRAQQAFSKLKSLVITLQRRFRAKLLGRQIRARFERQRRAAILIQRWHRSLAVMRHERAAYREQRQSCVRIQRWWLARQAGREQRQVFRSTLRSVVWMQRKWRATLAMRKQRQHFERLRAAAIVLQQRYRARLQMKKIRSQYELIRSLVVVLQRKFRAHQAMLLERKRFLLLRRTVVHLQQKFRGRKHMLEERNRFMALRSGITDFQARVRGLLARRRFQTLLTPEMREMFRRKRAVRLIQRLWRGYWVRKRMHNLRLKVIRKNIAALRDRSGVVNSIRRIVQNAVFCLNGRFKVSETLGILMQLDRLSRTVPHLLMPQSDFFSTFCYGIMAQAIRSEVDKQLIEYCSRILLNLSRYNSTTANTFQRNGWTTIAQILLRWCDKDCDIFNTLCTLIWVLGHCPQKREIIRNFMITPEAVFLLRETRKLVARKEKMRQNVRKTFATPRCPVPDKNFPIRSLPSLKPDFGVACLKPYIFISSEFAFETILAKLDIKLT